MGLRYSPDGAAIHRSKSGVGIVGRVVGACGVGLQVQPGGSKKKANCNCSWRCSDATANATSHVAHALPAALRSLLFLVEVVAAVAVAVRCRGLQSHF